MRHKRMITCTLVFPIKGELADMRCFSPHFAAFLKLDKAYAL